MKVITITNAYTWYNKGDAGILLGVVETLKKSFKGEELRINVLSFTPEEDSKRYCKDSTIQRVESNVLNPHPYKHTKVGKTVAMAKLVLRMGRLFIGMKLWRKRTIRREPALRLLDESDVIIVCGGGFLGGKKYDSLMHVFQIYIDTLFNRPVILMGTSVEPMGRGLIRRKTEKALRRVTHVFAREEITCKYLETFLAREKVTLAPDMAFILGEKKPRIKLDSGFKAECRQICGITLRDWNFPRSDNPTQAREQYIGAIINMMDELTDRGIGFVFVPQVMVQYADDAEVAKEVRAKLKNPKMFEIVEADLSPEEIKGLIAEFDFFVGTRMHSNIFAMSVGVPTVAIAYEKKTNGIMEMVDGSMKKYVIEIEDVTGESLVRKVDKMIEEQTKIRTILEKRITELRTAMVVKYNIKELVCEG